jgi:hypothetical protein
MSLANIQQGDVLTVRLYKQFAGYLWANNYEVEAVQDINNPAVALEALVTRLVALERPLHIPAVVIDRATVSTYVPDSVPYNPNALATFPIVTFGTRTISSDALPLEICLFVRRNVAFGRDGRLLYRGCLSEADMEVRGLRPIMTSSAIGSLQGIINSWSATGLGSQFRLVMASGLPVPTSVRPVASLQVADRIVVKKFNNRYFRRNP